MSWLAELQRSVHSPRTPDWGLIVTPGSQDGLAKVLPSSFLGLVVGKGRLQLFEAFLSPGDPLLIEEPSYPGTLAGVASPAPFRIGESGSLLCS